MPVLPGNQATTQTVQQLANQLKSNPEFFNILGGVAGYSTEPCLSLANEIMCRILAENMPWKWNRVVVPPFLTVSLQQDYVSNITNIGWLENGWAVDINNSTSNGNRAPKPIRGLETVRDDLWTSTQAVPFNVSFIPNTQASLGLWQPQTFYGCGYGVAQLPNSPIQQFLDANGNILYIDSTQLGLNIESPGYTGSFGYGESGYGSGPYGGGPIIPPGFYPYGTSGLNQPAAPPNATPGSQVTDGTVTWTVADQNGFCFRLTPLPALNGLCWWIVIQAQLAPPNLPTMPTSLAPIPQNMLYLFRQGMRAALRRENGGKDANASYAEWEETLVKAVRAGDRQQEDFAIIPMCGLMSGGLDPWGGALYGIGAANPYGPNLLGPGFGW